MRATQSGSSPWLSMSDAKVCRVWYIVRRRNPTVAVPRPAPRTEARPVLVATLEAPLVTEAAQLGVDSASLTGATRLYERAGMRSIRSYEVWEKQVGGAGS